MRLTKHNPALLSSSELVKQFVARKNDLDILIKTIRENIGRKANQHIMFIGPRGMGKTTLVMRAVVELHNIKNLNDNWLPVVMAEESYVVGNAGEFWLEAILRLAESLENNDLYDIHNKLLDEVDDKLLYEKALNVLLAFADKRKKRLIIFVENFNMLFDDKQLSNDDGWLLRETLINEPRIMMVATATSQFDQIDNIKQAMFELFAVRELNALSLSECRNIWNLTTKSNVSERRIRPLEILTGGNPRLLVILSSFATNNSFKRLIEDLVALIDDHTDYLKSNTESLPPLERKVFVSLADIWEPATAKNIGKLTRLNVNSTSTQLARLVKRGAVVVQRVEGRKKYYQLAERLYNIYHQMRRRGGQSDRVKTAVKFMISYYEDDKLCHMISSISKECVKLNEDERRDHFKVLEGLISESKDPEMKKKLIHSLEPEIFNFPDNPPGLRLFREEIYGEETSLIEHKNRYVFTSINKEKLDFNQKDVSNLTLLAKFIKSKPGIIEKALLDIKYVPNSKLKNCYLKEFAKIYLNTNGNKEQIPDQINENDSKCIYDELIKLANKFEENNQFKEANEALMNATIIEPMAGKAWNTLGRIFIKLKQLEEAEAHYKKAINLEPDNARYYTTYANSLSNDNKSYDKAEEYYKKAIDLNPENVDSLGDYTAFLYDIRKDYTKAEEYYRRAIELEPESINYNYNNYALLLSDVLKDYDKAEEYYNKAIELDPENVIKLCKYARFLSNDLKDYDKAEEYYNKAIELDPENVVSLGDYAALLYDIRKDYTKAEEYYRRAIELEPESINYNYNNYALLLSDVLKDYDKAEEYYKKAIDLDPEDVIQLENYARFLQNIRKDYTKAEEYYKRAIELEPESVNYNYNNYALILSNVLKDYDKAEEYYKKAINLDLENVIKLCNYARFLQNIRKNYTKAEEYYNKAIELDPENIGTLLDYARFLSNDLNDYCKSEEYYKRAIDLEPDNIDIFAEYCLCHIHQRKYDLAQKMCKDKFLPNSRIDNCEYTLGYIFYLLGWFDCSMQVFKNIFTNDPNASISLNNIGYLSLMTGSLEKAKTSLRQVLELSPDEEKNPLTTANLGLVLSKLEQFEEALEYFNKSMANISIDNAEGAELNSIVLLSLQLNLTYYYPKTEKWINLAREANPGLSEFAHTHACILAELGKWDKAIKAINEFLENDKFASNFVGDITAFFIKAARAGHAEKSLEIIINSPSSKYLEPLIVALQKYSGKQTNAPLEVYEVAKDIVSEINSEN